jgi:hypothetical protein
MRTDNMANFHSLPPHVNLKNEYLNRNSNQRLLSELCERAPQHDTGRKADGSSKAPNALASALLPLEYFQHKSL